MMIRSSFKKWDISHRTNSCQCHCQCHLQCCSHLQSHNHQNYCASHSYHQFPITATITRIIVPATVITSSPLQPQSPELLCQPQLSPVPHYSHNHQNYCASHSYHQFPITATITRIIVPATVITSSPLQPQSPELLCQPQLSPVPHYSHNHQNYCASHSYHQFPHYSHTSSNMNLSSQL